MSSDPGSSVPEESPSEDSAEGPAAAAASILDTYLRLARHVVELAAAELRLAALSGATMLILVIVAALMLVMAWGFVAAVGAYGLVSAGLGWPAAGLVVAAVHLLAAYLLWRLVVRLSRSLTLPQLRRTVLQSEETR